MDRVRLTTMVQRRAIRLSSVLLLISWSILVNAQNSGGTIKLRTGTVQLSPSTGGGTGGAAAAEGGVSSSPPGSTVSQQPPGWKLNLVRYTEGTQWALRNALAAAGVRILEFVADRTVLVYGPADAHKGPASRYGALIASYTPSLKITPEAVKVAQATSTAAKGLRRSLQTGSSATTATNPPVLNGIQTWRVRQTGTDDSSSGGSSSSRAGSPAMSPRVSGPAAGGAGTLEQYGILARLAPGLPKGELQAIMEQWPADLAAALGIVGNAAAGSSAGPNDPCWPRFVGDALQSTTSLLEVYCCQEDLGDAMTFLSSHDEVIQVEVSLAPQLHNANAEWIMQTGNLTPAQYVNPVAGTKPYWSANIQGQGIVVGMTDDGLDLSQCYFVDGSYRQGSLQTQFVGNPPRLYLPNHRKVVQYVIPEAKGVNWFGGSDQNHGSHTAGSIAGAVLNGTGGLVTDAGTGAAPFARISFFAGAKPGSNGFSVATPLDDKILPYHYAVGARLSSESWGLASALGVAYESTSRSFDLFAWRNPDFLSVISAGNFGGNGMTSVTAPGVAKNVLTVGASMNYPKNTVDGLYNNIIYFRYKDTKNQQFVFWPRTGSPMSSWFSLTNNKAVPVKLANPESACSPLSTSFAGSILLLDLKGATCAAGTSTANAVASGAVAVLYIVADDLFVDEHNWSPTGITIPYALVSRAQGLLMKSILKNSTITGEQMISFSYTSATVSSNTSSSANFGIDSLPYFSSYGPLPSGRIKPDIVAPGGPVASAAGGFLNSEATSSSCNTGMVSLQGTSMSTALVSGHLALVRQYFRDGYYPAGAAATPVSAPFEPSGMLLKAAAITGADSLVGGIATATGAVLGAAPDGYQGWGRFDMSGALPLPGLTAANFSLAVADLGSIRDGDYFFLKGIRATGSGPILATLVWHDYPGSGLSVMDLVNDLDLGFQINSNTNTTVFTRTRNDSVNNVERAELTGLKAKDAVTFVVYGKSIRHQLLSGIDAQLPQRWSLLVAGHFTGTLKTPLNPAYMRPQRLPDTRAAMQLWYSTTSCAVVAAGTPPFIGASTNCTNNPATTFTFVGEPADSRTGGVVYMIRDSQNRCWSLPSNSTGAKIVLATCNASLDYQKFAFYRNPYINNGSASYQLVSVPFLGNPASVSDGDRRCMRISGNSLVLQPSCLEDDTAQNFRLERPAAAASLPPLPPSPSPPAPIPSGQAEPWYPYPLLFRTDFYPVNGSQNTFDYDYDLDGPLNNTFNDLNIIVAWNWGGAAYKVTTLDAVAFATNMPSVMGAIHGGDNVDYSTMFEEVHFQLGFVPPPTVYHTCVNWLSSATKLMNVKLTVYRGSAVATVVKTFDTSLAPSDACDPTAPGYVGSYTYADSLPPRSPPAPPAPRAPVPVSYSNTSLLFRTDWTPVSGFTGRDKQLVDMDIVVSWTDSSGAILELGYDYSDTGGGVYGGNNLDKSVNYEFAYWPANKVPPTNTYHVCVRWYSSKKPLMSITMSVYRSGGLASTVTKTWDTTLDRVYLCNPSQNGYIASYTYIPDSPPPLPPPLSPPPAPAPPSNCMSLPSPSSIFSMYIRTQWTDGIQGSGAVYDWDMVVAWSFNGQDYVMTPDTRFIGGAVHSGDNIGFTVPANQEAVYWPTGFTGQAPAPTTYHVCVRWYQTGSLIVTTTVFFGTTAAGTAIKNLSSNTFHSKKCGPGANGYIGSFNYTGSGSNSSGGVFGPSGDFWSSSGGGSFTAKESTSPPEAAGNVGAAPALPPSAAVIDAPQPQSLGNAQASTDAGTVSGGSDGGGGGSLGKTLAIALSSALGGAALAAVGMYAIVRWRREKARNTRVVAM